MAGKYWHAEEPKAGQDLLFQTKNSTRGKSIQAPYIVVNEEDNFGLSSFFVCV